MGSKDAYVPYFYSTFDGSETKKTKFEQKSSCSQAQDRSESDRVLSSITRLEAVRTLRSQGCEAIIISNPETVSTDYTRQISYTESSA